MRIEDYKNDDENILWKGKPNKSVYIKERIFTPLALLALVWLIFDVGFISFLFGQMDIGNFKYIMIPFFIFHLFPVWFYLGKVIFSVREWNNTEYMITDKALYATSGIFTTNCNRKTFQEVTNVSFHQGIIDKNHNVGDVFVATGQETLRNGRVRTIGINIIDIKDYLKVYRLINRTSSDIFSDTMYPNDLRPNSNHGYNTQYDVNNDEKRQ